MLETILLTLLFAKIKGYKINVLFKSWEIYPIIILELLYILMQISVFNGYYGYIKYSGVFKTLYLSAFLFLILKYRQYIPAIVGSICIFIGSTLNNIAIGSNNGKMPVFPTISYYTGYIKKSDFFIVNDIHILGNETTKVKFLTDIFDFGYSIVSIGDIFIRLFVFIIIYNSIKCINKNVRGEMQFDKTNTF